MASNTMTNTPTDWESEFDRIPHGAPLSARGDYISVVNAKSFLTEKIAQARREGAEAAVGYIRKNILSIDREVIDSPVMSFELKKLDGLLETAKEQ